MNTDETIQYLLKKLVVNATVLFISFGFILPFFISAADTYLFLVGIAYIWGMVFFFYYYNRDMFITKIDDKKTNDKEEI